MSQREVSAKSEPATQAELQAAMEKYEFGAAWLPIMLLLPPLVYYMWICMTQNQGSFLVPKSVDELTSLVKLVPAPTLASTLFVSLWLGGQALLQVYAPGDWVEGTPLADGSRLPYKMNGWFSFWLTLLTMFFCCWMGWIPPTFLFDEMGPIISTTTLFCYGLSLYLYLKGKASPDKHMTGRVMYDYFMGSQLNPRVGRFDFKLFCEARPGLILWVLINFSIAAKQWQLHHTVSTPMMLVCLFQFFYIMDYFFHEEAILTTWDIKHERFGWMLCFGDLVWVPFTYSLQAQYLLSHPGELPTWAVLGIIALNLGGYAVFRGTNIQKHHFSRNPDHLIWGKPAKFIRTARGTKLLASGFWGLARHLNYCGDLMMALAWCLCAGVSNLLPYFYIIYFTILLIHRERRDDALCHAKYGADWEEYRRQVPSRIFPGIY